MQEGQNRKTSSLSIPAIAGVEPYRMFRAKKVYERKPSYRTLAVFLKRQVHQPG